MQTFETRVNNLIENINSKILTLKQVVVPQLINDVNGRIQTMQQEVVHQLVNDVNNRCNENTEEINNLRQLNDLVKRDFQVHDRQLDQLQRLIQFDVELNSVILGDNTEWKMMINYWLGFHVRWNLLWRGSRDTFTAATFHTKCNNKGSTLTIVRSQNGSIFGAYATTQFQSRQTYAGSSGWLFSFVRPIQGLPIRLLYCADNSGNVDQSIYDISAYGPTFGGGFDLHISDNCNANEGSYTNLGYAYASPKQYGTNESTNFLCGSRKFRVSEIEVFNFGF